MRSHNEPNTTLNEDAASYILHLERMVKAGEITQREAFQRAYLLGARRGEIAGLEKAQVIYGAPKP